MRNALLATTFFTAFGLMTAASAGVVTITKGVGPATANFNAFNNNAVGATSGTTGTFFGEVTFTTTPGTEPPADKSQVTDASVGDLYLQPAGDATNYIFAQAGGSDTLAFSTALTSVTIFWGSPDTYNELMLSNGDVITGTQLGLALGFSANGSNANSGWVTIADTTPFTSFTATTDTTPAFEFDLAGPTIPEPSTWAMLLLGFAGLGYAALRRNSKSRLTAEAI